MLKGVGPVVIMMEYYSTFFKINEANPPPRLLLQGREIECPYWPALVVSRLRKWPPPSRELETLQTLGYSFRHRQEFMVVRFLDPSAELDQDPVFRVDDDLVAVVVCVNNNHSSDSIFYRRARFILSWVILCTTPITPGDFGHQRRRGRGIQSGKFRSAVVVARSQLDR